MRRWVFAFPILMLFLSSFLISIPKVNADYDLSLGLVGYWNFDEGSGSVAHDLSGYGNNGIITNPYWIEGLYGKALNFDGSNTFVNCGEKNNFFGQWTFSIWINGSQTQTVHSGILGKDIAGNRMFFFKTQPYTTYALLSFERAGTTILDGSIHLYNNIRYFICVSYDGVNIQFYVNGVKDVNMASMAPLPVVTNNLMLGEREYIGAEQRFKGSLDESRLYDNAFSDSKIMYLYLFDPSESVASSGINAIIEEVFFGSAFWLGMSIMVLIIFALLFKWKQTGFITLPITFFFGLEYFNRDLGIQALLIWAVMFFEIIYLAKDLIDKD